MRTILHGYRFVDNAISPMPATPVEQAELVVGIPTSTANPSAHVKSSPGDPVPVGKLVILVRAQPGDRVFELRRNAFISIEAEDPVVSRCVDGELFLL